MRKPTVGKFQRLLDSLINYNEVHTTMLVYLKKRRRTGPKVVFVPEASPRDVYDYFVHGLVDTLYINDDILKELQEFPLKVQSIIKEKLSRVHSTFHVSNLKKCLSDEPLAIPLDEIHIDEKLHFIEEPVEIMDREVKRLKQSRIPIVKVRWNSKRGLEYTWEREDQMQKKYPHLFAKPAFASQATS
ncbi:hypothetical protein Tco_1165358 [Tanacetum coccineum]